MSIKDLYPLAEKAPDCVKTPTGKSLADITLDAVLAGDVTVADLAITPEALHLQAEIALAGGRHTLAENFHRAAELVTIPQEVIMETYEMLRPGRADRKTLHAQAEVLRSTYKAELLAKFIEEAAVAYERRGIFAKRY
jgi:propanediol dehydratase small subunit